VRKIINLLVILISLATIFSGLAQLFVPSFVLKLIGAEVTATSAHFFAIVGLFMALFGGLMLHAIYNPTPQRPAILWCAFQKLGAFVVVGLGIFNGIFAPIAVGIALFDLFSGLIFLYYLRLSRNELA